MPNDATTPRKRSKPWLLISLLVGVPALLTCCCGIGVGGWYAFFRDGAPLGVGGGGIIPGVTVARPDADNFENMRAWAEKSVGRLKAVDAKGNKAATDKEVASIEKEMRAALLNKKIRWSLPIAGVRDDGEVDLKQFYGKDDGKVADGPDAGKPRRKLYFRVYLDADGDEVRIGNEITKNQAKKGNRFTLVRTAIEANIRQRDNWAMPDRWENAVDFLDTFCIDVIVKRK